MCQDPHKYGRFHELAEHFLLLLEFSCRARPHEQRVIAYTAQLSNYNTLPLVCEAFGFETLRLFAAGHQDVQLCCVFGNSHSVVPVVATH